MVFDNFVACNSLSMWLKMAENGLILNWAYFEYHIRPSKLFAAMLFSINYNLKSVDFIFGI